MGGDTHWIMDANHLDQAMKAFRIAVGRLGGQTPMAPVLKLSQQAVSKRLKNNIPLQSQDEVFAVEAATGVSRHDLRPDLYPREEDTSPPRDPAQHPAAQPSAPAAQAPPPPAVVDGPSPALDYPSADPLKGMAA